MIRIHDDAHQIFKRAWDIAVSLKFPELGSTHVLLAFTEVEEYNEYLKLLGFSPSAIKSYVYEVAKKLPKNTIGLSGELDLVKMSSELAATLNISQLIDRYTLFICLIKNNSNGFRSIREKLSLEVNPNPNTNDYQKSLQSDNFCRSFDTQKLISFAEIEKYGKVLTEAGSSYDVFGRDKEIDELVNVLLRKNKNNPCLVGDAGVGKTAIVYGFANRLINDDVPNRLKGMHIFSIDYSKLVAGTKYRGDFEERLEAVMKFAIKNPSVILFFDEIHAINGCGASDGGLDALSLLKPLLSTGVLKIIGATTSVEYRKRIDSDAAFARRLQKIEVCEPTKEDCNRIIMGLQDSYEKFHQVKIEKKIISKAIELSIKYLPAQCLPDKAITIIDETMATVYKLGRNKVNIGDIEDTIERHTGICMKNMSADDLSSLIQLEDTLHKGIIGQSEAVSIVSKAIRRNKVGIRKHDKPIGSFMFVGPTGVGKTELTKVLCNWMTGAKLIRFDMSEFKESHSISKLIGSPPGYVGFGDGGLLTEAIRRNPYAVVLFDEIEKAHPDVTNILLQIMDEGMCTDSHGMKVDFKNSIIITSSNLGSKLASSVSSIGFGADVQVKKDTCITEAINNFFSPELINRFDAVVNFHPLDSNDIQKIASKLLSELNERLAKMSYKVEFDKNIVEFIANKGFDAKFGARNIKRVIQCEIEDYISDSIINGDIKPNKEILLAVDGQRICIEKAIAYK